MATHEMGSLAQANKKYFKSFSSYEVPFVPQDEINFVDTEQLGYFYIGNYDSKSRLTRLTKIWRSFHSSRPFVIQDKLSPGGTIYFESDTNREATTLGKHITYAETENRSSYFQGLIEEDGLRGDAVFVRRVPVFVDVYEYWPNGIVRSRTLLSRESEAQVWHYDESGGEIADLKEEHEYVIDILGPREIVHGISDLLHRKDKDLLVSEPVSLEPLAGAFDAPLTPGELSAVNEAITVIFADSSLAQFIAAVLEIRKQFSSGSLRLNLPLAKYPFEVTDQTTPAELTGIFKSSEG